MTEVEVEFAVEKQIERGDDEADFPDIAQLVDEGNSSNYNNEISLMSSSQTDTFYEPNNSSGPIRPSVLKDNRWKPYSERERQRLEEQNSRRAILAQKELLRCGLSLSPSCVPHYHRSDSEEVDKVISRDVSTSSLEESNLTSPEDEDKPIPADDYAGKSNLDLVKEFMEAEDKLEELSAKVNSTRLNNLLVERTSWFDVEAEMEKIRVFRKEIEKLTNENNYLLVENQKLELILSGAA